MCHIIINNNLLQQTCSTVEQHLLHVLGDSSLDNQQITETTTLSDVKAKPRQKPTTNQQTNKQNIRQPVVHFP